MSSHATDLAVYYGCIMCNSIAVHLSTTGIELITVETAAEETFVRVLTTRRIAIDNCYRMRLPSYLIYLPVVTDLLPYLKVKKVEGHLQLLTATHHRATERHLPYGITRRYLLPNTGEAPRLNSSQPDLRTPEGWKAELTSVLVIISTGSHLFLAYCAIIIGQNANCRLAA